MKAKLGDGAIYSKIGDIYFNKKDYFKAASWHKLGADKKMTNSQYRMGWMLQYGSGVIASYKLAMTYYMNAQEKGHLMAANSIGYMYEKGLGVNRSF
jgi:TPR repeat protein